MEEEKIKRKLKHLIKNIETELINITWPAAIKQELPETEILENIAAERNEDVATYSGNMVLEDECNQRTDEELDKHRKCELNTVILEEKKCKDSVSNVLTPGNVSFELNRFESFPRQTGSSSSSASSQSSFVIVEPESSVNEKFEFGDLKEESNPSLKVFTITDNKMISQDTVDKKQSDTVAKYFDISENTGREQDSSLLIKDEIKDLRRTLGKCFSYLGKLEAIALKRDKLHLEESNKFSKYDENDVKIEMIRKKDNNSDLTLSPSHTLNNNISTYANNKKSLQERLVHSNSYRNGYMEFSNGERYAYDRCNRRCFNSNSFVFEWGLDTYVIQEDENCSIQTFKSDITENPLLNSLVTSPGEIDMVEKDWSEEYYSKNNKKSNLNKTKAAKNNTFKSRIPSFSNIGEKKELWEYYRNINLYHHQQKVSDLTNSIAAKNQSSDEASPKKHDAVQKEIIERLCRERNEVVTKLERISDLIDETEKQRIMKRRQDKEFDLICLILLFVYLLVICCCCFAEFSNVD